MTHRVMALMVGAAALGWSMSAQAVEVGDAAPPLEIAEWVKGDAVTLGKTNGKPTVVEFWATWCGPCRASIPHLTELAAKFESAGVRFVAISSEEASIVRPFVEQQGPAMGYTVAVDRGGRTTAAYGIRGFPTAFIVGGDGSVVWTGHPMQPDFETTLAEFSGDDYDPAVFAEHMKLLRQYQSAARLQDYPKALKLIDELIAVDPKRAGSYEAYRLHCLVMNVPTRKQARDQAEGIIGRITDARELAKMAWRMMEQEEGYHGQYDDVALKAAERANSLMKDDLEVLRSLAYAKFLNRDAKAAIEIQKRALELAGPDQKAEIQADLDFYMEDAG